MRRRGRKKIQGSGIAPFLYVYEELGLFEVEEGLFCRAYLVEPSEEGERGDIFRVMGVVPGAERVQFLGLPRVPGVYVAVAVRRDTAEEAVTAFEGFDREVMKVCGEMGFSVRGLSAVERLRVMFGVLHPETGCDPAGEVIGGKEVPAPMSVPDGRGSVLWEVSTLRELRRRGLTAGEAVFRGVNIKKEAGCVRIGDGCYGRFFVIMGGSKEDVRRILLWSVGKSDGRIWFSAHYERIAPEVVMRGLAVLKEEDSERGRAMEELARAATTGKEGLWFRTVVASVFAENLEGLDQGENWLREFCRKEQGIWQVRRVEYGQTEGLWAVMPLGVCGVDSKEVILGW